MELHVPCRDPLARLMSGCHFRHHTFDCDTDDLEREIEECTVAKSSDSLPSCSMIRTPH